MVKLLYQGHASFRITTNNDSVIYVDPYAGKGYEKPADIILVTHQHRDHNKVKLVTQKPDCRLITNKEALKDGKHQMFDISGIIIEAVEACNSKHDPKKCVGYVITLDGIKIYAAGDTSKTSQMAKLAEKHIDYALFPTDGLFNMGLAEAAECAGLVGAKHNIPIHMNPLKLFDKNKAAKWNAPNKLIVTVGEEITL
jgi:L-ascorbate metabolism protein UlaG (beta-lactamase superfamily)